MDPSLQLQRAADLRRRLAELAAETFKVEDELAAIETEGQLKLRPTAAATSTPRTPADKIGLFLELFGTRRSVFPKR